MGSWCNDSWSFDGIVRCGRSKVQTKITWTQVRKRLLERLRDNSQNNADIVDHAAAIAGLIMDITPL